MATQATIPTALSANEKLFFSRVAIKVAEGEADFEAACRAVLSDDRRIVAQVQSLRSYDRDYFDAKLAHQVFAGVHANLAYAR